MPDINIVQETQYINSKGLLPNEVIFDPNYVLRYFINNIFSHSFSHLIGYDGINSHLLKSTLTGALHVANVSSGLNSYNELNGSAPDSYADASGLRYVAGYNRVDILVENNAAIIQFRNNTDTAYLGDIFLPIGRYSFDFVTQQVRIKNRIAGRVCAYQLLGWY